MSEQADFPSALRAIRSALNLTQEQLADRLGVSFATVNRWEAGARRPQRAARATIAALAAEAGIDKSSAASDSTEAAALVTGRRRRARSTKPSTKPMEQMLWDAACSIRGEKDAGKFKDYLLPLLFLKRLSDVFDDEIDRLAEEYGDRSTALEIAEQDHELLRFYLPREARWAVISGREEYAWPLDEHEQSTRPRDIGEHLTKAVRSVVKQNPTLSGVIDVVDFGAERNGERDVNPAKLREVVETFSDPRYRLGLADVQPDFLGRAYEYLLRKFAEGSSQSAGEYFTPTEVGFLMAHILRPRPGEECHDYACGSAGLLVKLQLVARELDPTSKVPLKLYGQELTAESYAVAQMNAIIHDMNVEFARGDTMINPKFKTADSRLRTYDIVVANPMWNQPFNPDIFADDPFDRFRPQGGVTTGKGDWAWLQHTLSCLNDRGRAAVVLDTPAVERGSGSTTEVRERNIRKWFVDHDLIDGVILLPENLFYNTPASGIIVVLSRRKPPARKNKIFLLNASRCLRKGRPKNYIPEEEILPLAASYLKGEALPGVLAVVTRQQAEEADYNLSPSRWAGRKTYASDLSVADLLARNDEITSNQVPLDQQLREALVGTSDQSFRQLILALPKTSLGALLDAGHIEAVNGFACGEHNSERVGVLHTRPFNITTSGEISLTEQKHVAFASAVGKPTLRLGDVLFNNTNTKELVGKTALWDGPDGSSFSNHMTRLRAISDGISGRFLAAALHAHWISGRSEVLARAHVAQASILGERFREIEIPWPSAPVQEKLASVFEAQTRQLALAREKRSLLEQVSRVMLEELIEGPTADSVELTPHRAHVTLEGESR